jgi:hypothetical protein
VIETASPPTPRSRWLLDGSSPATSKFALTSALGVTAAHLALWGWAMARRHESFGSLLLHWDSGHYSAIATDGYSGKLWVFFPAYPFTVRALAWALRVSEVQWVGFGLSSFLFLAFVWLCGRAAARPELPAGLVPRTRLGWLFFLLGPASYVFHSHHTESLFVLLSFGAFFFAATRRPVAAGLFAAACLLTRNQGVFVGLAAALLAATVEAAPLRRVRALLVTAALAASGGVAFLVFQRLAAGSALAFLAAQRAWAHVDSPLGALETLVFGNPWQSTDAQNLLRYGAWWLFVGGSVALARRTPALGLYALLGFLVQLPQGELINTFRFAAPVFPLFFFLGDASARWPRWLQGLALVALGLINLDTARRYGVGLWAY